MKSFYQIDLFGKAVLFNYKGNSKSKSKIGAIFTVVLFAFAIWLTVYFGKQLLNKRDPKATTFESFNDNPAATPFTIDNFAMGIGMSNPDTYVNYINESIYTLHATTYKTTRVPLDDGSVNITYEIVTLEMEACRPDHFGELSEKFAYSGLDGLYCFKKEQPNLNNGQPILEGNWESPVFQGIFIDLLQCNRNVSGHNCGTQEEIDALLEAGLLTVTFTNAAVDLTDNTKPLTRFRDGWYTSTGNSFNKEINLYLEELEINTDNGWLTNDINTDHYIRYSEIREMFSLTKKSNYAHFVIRLSNVKKHFNRSYNKIQDVIAQVNGTIAVTFTVLFLLLAPYVRLKFYEALINEIFDIKSSRRVPKDRRTKSKPKQNKPNAKTTNQQNKPKVTLNTEVVFSNEDLEQQQKCPLKSNRDQILTNRIESTDRKDTDDANLIKAIPTSEETHPTKYNFASIIQSPSSPFISRSHNFLETEAARKTNHKLNFSNSRGLSGIPLNFSGSQFENKPETHSDLPSPPQSPRQSKRQAMLISRKPTFLQPNFKILDYEDHGQDLLEDILKNIYPEKKKKSYNKEPAEELVISDIVSEENENGDFSPIDEKERDLKVLSQDEILSEGEEKQEKIENLKEEVNEKDMNKHQPHAKYKLQRLDLITTKNIDEINLTFWEYIRSFFSRSDAIKMKMRILNEGIKRINERLDIFNLFKKLREFDKLKLLLLESEQFVLFDSLPRPELSLKDINSSSNPDLSHSKIKDPQFIQEKIKKDLILLSYERLKRKTTTTTLDKKLFEIYDDILDFKS